MNIKRQLLTTLAFLAVASQALAQEIPSFETVVEDVIFNTSTRTIIDEKTIRESRAPNITTLLSTQSNVTITNTPFQPNSIYIRGGDAGHILIIIDGIPFYDASTIQRTFNLNSLDVKSVRKIEIIKGSQTVLYGGQALSGVIKIDTIPTELEQRTTLQAQGGTHNMKDLAFTHTELTGSNRAMLLRGQGTWRDSQSPVLDSSKTYGRNTWNGEAAYAWKAAIDGHVKAQYIQELNWSPTSGMNYKIEDSDDFEQFYRQLAASTHLKFNELAWNPRLSLGVQNSARQFKQPQTLVNPFETDQDYNANLHSMRLDLTPVKTDKVQIHAGASYIYEQFRYKNKGVTQTDDFSEQRGIFAKADIEIDKNLSVSAGARAENWGDKNPIGTYQVGVTAFQNTKLEFSTGYKIPSLFQLYSDYGNPDLQEERAQQWALTQDIPFNEFQNFSITLFNSEYSNLIVTRGGFPNLRYENVSKATSRGLELAYSLRSSDVSSWLFSYGYQEPRDADKHTWLLRRPLVNGSVRYMFSSRPHSASFELMGAGQRTDRITNTQTVMLPGYMTANASYSYQFDELLTLYVRVNNLANYRYQETYSYYTEGTSAYVGAEYIF